MNNNTIFTVFKQLDKYLKNMKRNALVYICAKPGIGLKTFTKNIFDNLEFYEINGRYPPVSLFELSKEKKMPISKIRQKIEEKSPSAVCLNCLQYIGTDTKYDNKIQRISEISYQLKQMANELNMLTICAMQLPAYESKPSLRNLMNFGSIVQDADVIMFLHRDDITAENIGNIDTAITELIIAKNRYGGTGTIKLKYNLETNQFTEVDTL